MASRSTPIPPAFVIDASVAVTWLFEDETHAGAVALLAAVRDGNSVGFVTRHWHLEVRNALLIGERGGRITLEQIGASLALLNELPLHTDTEADLDVALYLARRYDLTIYDAVYLELAVRRRLPLATFDRRLGSAASEAGLDTLP